jgi:hypothetical protein
MSRLRGRSWRSWKPKGVCRRSAASCDPLLRVFLERYHLNLLAVPRENADVGDVYVHDGKRAGSPGQLASFLTHPFRMPQITRGEELAALSGTMSNQVTTEVGLGLLGSFIAARRRASDWGRQGGMGEEGRAKRPLQNGRGRTGQRRSRPVRGASLIDNSLRQDHPLVDPNSRFFFVSAVARCKALSVAFVDDRGQTLDIGAEIAGIGDAKTGVGGTKSSDGEVTFAGSKWLAFGVELYELFVAGGRIRMKLPDAALNVRSARRRAIRPAPVLLGSDDDEVFLNV